MFVLHPFQADEKARILAAWIAGHRYVLEVLPTGSGKTVLFSDIIQEHDGASCAIAHRQELVSQISLALARNGVRHRIIGPKNVVKLAVSLHMDELGRSYYDPSARCAVAGVDTLIRRQAELGAWMRSVTLWVMDEAHHVLTENKWGKAVEMFPNAKGLGVTATPLRADRKGLGHDTDGVFHEMFVGPSMRDLINMGYLTEYRVFAPLTDINFEEIGTSDATGDFKSKAMVAAIQRSQIVGDVVEHYKRIAPGKLGITFASDVATATEIARKFNQQGVPAEVVSAKTPDRQRVEILRRFRKRELLQLVNVDLFGEGFDLPAIEVVSMARPTKSFALFAQQFGRALRTMEGKTEAIIIDHVGNISGAEHSHGLPDGLRAWSLARPSKGSRSSTSDLKTCQNVDPYCFRTYPRIDPHCPYCGMYPDYSYSDRSSPQFVEGDLTELLPEVLAQMRGEIALVDRPAAEYRAELAARNVPAIGQMGHVNRYLDSQEMQAGLRASIAWWAGYHRAAGDVDAKIYRRFYREFGIDMMSAQTLKEKEADGLGQRINKQIGGLV